MFAQSALTATGRSSFPPANNETWLTRRFDAVLGVTPVVASVSAHPRAEALLRSPEYTPLGLAVRRVQLDDGRTLVAIAVPSSIQADPEHRSALVAVKHLIRQRALLLPEAALNREPRLGTALLVADAAGIRVSPTDRLGLQVAMLETGGSMPLADAASLMVRADDPVAAVLSLVAGRTLTIDLDRRLSPATRVASRPELRHRGVVLGRELCP